MSALSDFRAICDRSDAHCYFFTPENMRFFRSVILPTYWRNDFPDDNKTIWYFVTSERFESLWGGHFKKRLYTTRMLVRDNLTGRVSILDIGEFQQYGTAKSAYTAARNAWAAEMRD